jgi:hypothetical protein
MLDQVREVLNNAAPARTQIQAAVAELWRDEQAVLAAIDELRRRRFSLLLNGSDQALDECERELAVATRQLERVEVAQSVLHERLEARPWSPMVPA